MSEDGPRVIIRDGEVRLLIELCQIGNSVSQSAVQHLVLRRTFQLSL
ncbi:hypothetical protein A2U01_0045520, partial [Trifolium medium]|nr:hypothetical protein [Trifolium medium]